MKALFFGFSLLVLFAPVQAAPIETLRIDAETAFSLMGAFPLESPGRFRALRATARHVPAAPSAESMREFGVEIPSHNGWTNKGKLALPGDFGPMTPAVVLIHGSGPLDMDATMPGSITSDGRPSPLFKDLSDALAGAGFAVLRYNKRGVLGWDADSQRSLVDTKVYAANRVEDLVMDAAAAVRFLRVGPGSGSRPVLLLGISEGAVLAPLAARLERVDGMILLSAMARRLDVLVRFQLVTRQLGWVRDIVDEDRDGFVTREEASRHPKFELDFAADTDGDGRLSMPELEVRLEAQFREIHGRWSDIPWYRSHLELAPNEERLPGFRGPILIAQGEADAQTPLEEARRLEAALAGTGHPAVTVRTFPGLGHGFSRDGWEPTVGPIAPSVLEAVACWARAVEPFGR